MLLHIQLLPFASRSVSEIAAHLENVAKALYEYRWEGKIMSQKRTAGVFLLTALPSMDDPMRFAETKTPSKGFRLTTKVEVRAGYPKDILLVGQMLGRVVTKIEAGEMQGFVDDKFGIHIGSFRR